MDEQYYKNAGEIWKDIKGYESLYQVSDFGRIKSLNYNHTKREQILKPHKDNRKRLHVILHKNGVRKTSHVHKLVMEAFVGPCPKGMEICHNDGNPENNYIKNLRYDTHKNNIKDKIKHGTLLYGQKHPWAKVDNKQALEIKKLAEKGDITQAEIGKLYNIKGNTVSSIKTGTNWKHLDE